MNRVIPTLVIVLSCACTSDDDAGTRATDAAAGDTGADAAAAPTLHVEVSGPVEAGMPKPFTASRVDLATHGYSEKERFFEGEATSYTLDGKMTMDGKWTLHAADSAHYKTRMLVRRPTDAKAFNGTVIVEWLNVSGGADGDPGFMYAWEEVLRGGYAWVGVSAQVAGVEGGGLSLSGMSLPLKKVDAERYGSLEHPGDAYSFDIYTQAARIVRGDAGVDVLDGLTPKWLMAYGESQSAMRLVSYVDGVQPIAQVFDGFFIHSRSAGALPFTSDATFAIGGMPVHIRDDLEAEVFQFQTETDVFSSLTGYLAARQPDSDRVHTWEVAGTAHADAHILQVGVGEDESPIACKDVNDGPQHFVIKAALHALQAWMTEGVEPAPAELLMADDAGKPVTDEHGNTLGGVRTPAVEVPIATLSGLAPTGSDILCSLFGQTTPFSADELEALYASHDDYVAKVKAAADAAEKASFILPPERAAIVEEANAAAIPH